MITATRLRTTAPPPRQPELPFLDPEPSEPLPGIPRAPDGRRLRVLVIAEACNPTWASVPLVGYSMARALAEHPGLDVTVATHVRNRTALAGDPLTGAAEICFIDNEF